MLFVPTLESIWLSCILAIATSIISITVTQTEVTRPLREFLNKKSKFFGYLFSCFYCLSHWIVFILVYLYHIQLVPSENFFINFAVTSFFIIGLSTLFSGFVFKVKILAMNRHKAEIDMLEQIKDKK